MEGLRLIMIPVAKLDGKRGRGSEKDKEHIPPLSQSAKPQTS